MHASAMARMTECFDKYLSKDRHYDVLDFGSFINEGQTQHHRTLLADYDTTIVGVDILSGRNVDIQMVKPYRIPVPSNSQDVVLSGQVFEHIPYPWASILEVARVLKPNGLFFLTAPSRGHQHFTYDPWRYYPDSMRSLAAQADLDLLEAYTDFPPIQAGTRNRLDYAAIDIKGHYWGDTTGVFRKPQWKFSVRRWLVREVTVRNANRIGDMSAVPRAPRKPRKPQ
jgi:SAM-dependent methyltransferase